MPFMLTDKRKALNRLWNAVAFDLRQAFGMAHFHICHLFHLFQQPLKISFRNGKPQCWLYFIRSQFAYIQDSKRFFRFKREKNWKRENWFQQKTKTEICASNKWKSQPFKSHKDHLAIMMRFFVRIPSLHHSPLSFDFGRNEYESPGRKNWNAGKFIRLFNVYVWFRLIHKNIPATWKNHSLNCTNNIKLLECRR